MLQKPPHLADKDFPVFHSVPERHDDEQALNRISGKLEARRRLGRGTRAEDFEAGASGVLERLEDDRAEKRSPDDADEKPVSDFCRRSPGVGLRPDLRHLLVPGFKLRTYPGWCIDHLGS